MEWSRLISSKRFWSLIFFTLILISSQVFLHRNLAYQETVGKVVNLAGRQRLLSQRVLSYSCMVTQTNSGAEATSELLLATSSWYDSHLILLNGSTEVDIPPPDETLEAEMLGLSEIVNSSKDIVLNMVDAEEDRFLELKELIDRYLPRMDLAVSGLADRASQRTRTFKVISILSNVLVLVFGVLLYSNYKLSTS